MNYVPADHAARNGLLYEVHSFMGSLERRGQRAGGIRDSAWINLFLLSRLCIVASWLEFALTSAANYMPWAVLSIGPILCILVCCAVLCTAAGCGRLVAVEPSRQCIMHLRFARWPLAWQAYSVLCRLHARAQHCMHEYDIDLGHQAVPHCSNQPDGAVNQ